MSAFVLMFALTARIGLDPIGITLYNAALVEFLNEPDADPCFVAEPCFYMDAD